MPARAILSLLVFAHWQMYQRKMWILYVVLSFPVVFGFASWRHPLQLAHLQAKRSYLAGVRWHEPNLEGANLEGANLEGACLLRARLEGANLRGANLKGSKLTGARYDASTRFPSDDFDPEAHGMIKVVP